MDTINTNENTIQKAAIDSDPNCHYCANGQTDKAIQLSELHLGFEAGCSTCLVLSRGLAQLRESLFDKDLQLFDNLTGIVVSSQKLMRRKAPMIPAVDCAVLPLDIYSDPKATSKLINY
jgi:hypothetical protein